MKIGLPNPAYPKTPKFAGSKKEDTTNRTDHFERKFTPDDTPKWPKVSNSLDDAKKYARTYVEAQTQAAFETTNPAIRRARLEAAHKASQTFLRP